MKADCLMVFRTPRRSQSSNAESRFNETKLRKAFQAEKSPPPPNLSANATEFLRQSNRDLDEDNPELHTALRALTRLARHSVSAICLGGELDGQAHVPIGRSLAGGAAPRHGNDGMPSDAIHVDRGLQTGLRVDRAKGAIFLEKPNYTYSIKRTVYKSLQYSGTALNKLTRSHTRIRRSI